MSGSNTRIRQFHRWLSVAFTAGVVINILAVQGGVEPPVWVYFLAGAPLAVLWPHRHVLVCAAPCHEVAQRATLCGVNTMASSSKKKSTKRSPKTASGQVSASERIDKMIAGLEDWRGERLAEIRQLIHEVDPEVVEEWKWMGSPVWSHNGMCAVGNAHKDKVKVTFCHGAQLDDPKKLFNAGLSGNKWRAIDLREEDKLDKPGLAALLRRAIAYNKKHSMPKSKGSKA